MNKTYKAILAIATSATIYAFTGFFIRFLTSLHLNVYSINFIELFFGLPIIYLTAKIAGERIDRPSCKELFWLVIIGICHFGVTMTLFYAYNYTSIANVEFLHFTFPIFTMLGAMLLFREHMDKWKIMALCISIIGLLLIFNPTLTFSKQMNFGNLLAVSSAIPISVMTLSGRRLKDHSAYFTAFWSTIVAACIYFPLFITHNSIPWQSLWRPCHPYLFLFDSTLIIFFKQIGAIALASLIFIAVAAPLYYYGLKYLEASKASILLLMEILVATVAAVALYNEIPSPQESIGGILILLSGFIVMKSKSPLPLESHWLRNDG